MNTRKDDRFATWMLAAWASLWLFSVHYFQPNAGGSGLAIANNNTSWLSMAMICAVGFWAIFSRNQLRWHSGLNGLLMVAAALLLHHALLKAGQTAQAATVLARAQYLYPNAKALQQAATSAPPTTLGSPPASAVN